MQVSAMASPLLTLPLSRPASPALRQPRCLGFVFNEGYDCAVHQHMDAKRACKFKNELVRFVHHKSKRPCQRTHHALHHTSPSTPFCPATSAAPKTSFCTHETEAEGPPCRHPPEAWQTKPLTPADLSSSLRREWQQARQPGFNKSLPLTCHLPGNTRVGFAKSGTQIYGDDGSFNFFIYFFLFTPSSPALHPNSPGL